MISDLSAEVRFVDVGGFMIAELRWLGIILNLKSGGFSRLINHQS